MCYQWENNETIKEIPFLRGEGRKARLIVDGEPLFLRAGEVHNSSASSLEYMDTAVWPKLESMHLNSLIIPIYWELLEQERGVYDFTLVDNLILQARERKIRLVFLWFGLWKNGSSYYVPGWMRRDRQHFFPIVDIHQELQLFRGERYYTISPMCQEAVDADAACFGMLLRHLKEFDGKEHTVVMVQVENEIGVLGQARDYSDMAEEMFADQIPELLRRKLALSGITWEQCFDENAEESFMAWHYASAVERIAAAGKKEYPLPMYCNAWLRQTPRHAGEYPSGGPQIHNQAIWRVAAPSIDFYAPDIYLSEFDEICEAYYQLDNPVFVPEARNTLDAVSYYLFAAGRYGAMCFSPFGIEDMEGDTENVDEQMLKHLDIDSSALASESTAGVLLGSAYQQVEGLERMLPDSLDRGRLHGYLEQGEWGIDVTLQKYVIRIEYITGKKGWPKPAGLLMELSGNEFILLAVASEFHCECLDGRPAEIEYCEEGQFTDGKWERLRRLNGDERYSMKCKNMPRMLRCKILEL